LKESKSKAISLLKDQMQEAHNLLEATMKDIDFNKLNWIPPGTANPLGATYAHAIVAEDRIVNGLLNGKTPLSASDWAGKTGESEPMPRFDTNEWSRYYDWTRKVRINLNQMRHYAQAVYKNTEDYLSSLSEEELDKKIKIEGMGEKPLSWILTEMLIAHTDNITGEISAVKGMQGLKGYPF
jgi:hypothetical protein